MRTTYDRRLDEKKLLTEKPLNLSPELMAERENLIKKIREKDRIYKEYGWGLKNKKIRTFLLKLNAGKLWEGNE